VGNRAAHGISRATFLQGAGAMIAGLTLGKPATAEQTVASMQTRPIPSSGKPLPIVGCGTYRTFDVGSSPAEREQIAGVLRELFAAGGSVIDSSPMYGRAEGVAGDALAAAGIRDKAFIATKVWTSGREAGIAQMQRSFDLFHTDHIELMQIHNLLDWRPHLATLRAWKQERRIAYLGVTHYTPGAYDQLEAVMRAEPLDFVQLNYAIDDRTAEERLLPLAADRGIAILVNQPFGGGDLLRRVLGKPLPALAGEIDCKSWPQLLLKFVLAHPAVTCVIPGTGKPEHMRDNVQAGSGPLPDAAMRAKLVSTLGF
jgi:aryl-alcohol dehydrogenase-like predicted oxidoreductase